LREDLRRLPGTAFREEGGSQTIPSDFQPGLVSRRRPKFGFRSLGLPKIDPRNAEVCMRFGVFGPLSKGDCQRANRLLRMALI
jgi:hypothetical protein